MVIHFVYLIFNKRYPIQIYSNNISYNMNNIDPGNRTCDLAVDLHESCML